MTNQNSSTDEILDRLANEAEEHLHRDVEGRRTAARDLLNEMVKILAAAQQFDSAAYATSTEPNGNVVIGDYAVVRIKWDGDVVVDPVDIMAPKLNRPMLKYNARRRAWEHCVHPGSVDPVHAVLDVVLPFVFSAIRRERGMPRERTATGREPRMTQFLPSLPMDPRGWLGNASANITTREE